MSESHPQFGALTVPSPPASSVSDASSKPTPAIEPPSASQIPPTTTPPVDREHTSSFLKPVSVNGQPPPVRHSSRLKHEEVYDFNAPVVLHEYIEERGLAVEEVLTRFGFALCDEDSLCHPHAQFACQSKGEACCKWRIGTIRRCSITTEITRMQAGTLVRDLDPLGSLHHPQCSNERCKWGTNPKHIMRLEKGQLVTRGLTPSEATALRARERGKWYGSCQDEYPRPIETLPFSRNPNGGPAKKRKITVLNATNSATPQQPSLEIVVPISPESQPGSPAPEVPRKDKAARSRRPNRQPTTTFWETDSIARSDKLSNAGPNDQDIPFDDDVTDGSVLKDHLIVSKPHYDDLKARVESLTTLNDDHKRDADQQARLAKQATAEAEQSIRRQVADEARIKELEEEKASFVRQADRRATLLERWHNTAQKASTELEATKKKDREIEEKEKAVEVENASLRAEKVTLEKETAALQAELNVAQAKAAELEAKGKRMFALTWDS